MQKNSAIIWTKGGIRPSCGPWDPLSGRTGFVWKTQSTYIRQFEEPNLFSKTIRLLMNNGYIGIVDLCEEHLLSYDELMNAIVWSGRHRPVVTVMLVKEGCPVAHWMRVCPSRRVSPKETWVIDWSCDDVEAGFALDA